MSEASSQIVVTGVGIVSPLGFGFDAYADALEIGKSVVRKAGERHTGSPVKYVSEVDEFDSKKWVRPRKSIKLMCREIQFSVGCAELAIQHAGLDVSSLDPERIGVCLGSEFLYGSPLELEPVYTAAIASGEFSTSSFGDNIAKLFPLWMLKYLPNMPACHVGIAQNALGHNNSIVQGETSSILSLAESVSVIERGWTDVMIAGGVGTELRPARVANLSNEIFSQLDVDPETVCRPFDACRSGSAGSEVATAFVLETESHALARGAKPLARIAGFGRAFQLQRPLIKTQENGSSVAAIRRSIENAMQQADCTASDIDHVNTHGAGTRMADQLEAQAIQGTALKDTPATAIKSYTGLAGAGSGAAELAASIAAMVRGTVPKTLNYESADDDCPINLITEPKPFEKPAALVVNQSFLGQAAAVVIQQP